MVLLSTAHRHGAFRGDLHSISLRRAASVCHRLSHLSLSLPLSPSRTHTHTHILSLFLSGFFFSRFVSLVPSEYSSFFLQSTGRCSLSFFLPSLFSFPPSLSLEGYPLCFDQTFFRLFVLASSRAGNRRLAPRDTLWLPRKTRDSFVASRKEGTRVVIEFPLFFSSSLSR